MRKTSKARKGRSEAKCDKRTGRQGRKREAREVRVLYLTDIGMRLRRAA